MENIKNTLCTNNFIFEHIDNKHGGRAPSIINFGIITKIVIIDVRVTILNRINRVFKYQNFLEKLFRKKIEFGQQLLV